MLNLTATVYEKQWRNAHWYHLSHTTFLAKWHVQYTVLCFYRYQILRLAVAFSVKIELQHHDCHWLNLQRHQLFWLKWLVLQWPVPIVEVHDKCCAATWSNLVLLYVNEKKVEFEKYVDTECGKKMSKYILIGLKKKTCLGDFRIEEIRDNDNETGLKDGKRNRNVNLQCFPYTRCSLPFAFRFFVFYDNYN